MPNSPFLQPQNIPISFQGGLSSKNDELQVQPPNLLELENAVFDKIGRLNKRYGYDILSKEVVSGNTINSCSAIDNFNNELNLFDNRYLYTYSSQNMNWINRGTAISLINTNNQIVRSASNQQLNPDSAILNNLECYVAEDSRGTIRYSILDTDTQAYLVYDQSIVNSINNAKVVAFNNLFYIFYSNNNNIYFRTIDPDNPSVISTQSSIISTLYLESPYDVYVKDNNLWVAYFSDNDPLSDTINVLKMETNEVFVVYEIATDTITDNNYTAISTYVDSLGKLWVAWSTGTALKYRIQQASSVPTTVLTTTTIASAVTPNVTIIETPNTPGSSTVFYQVNAALSYNHLTKATRLTTAGAVEEISTIRSLGLASKAFLHNELLHVNLVHESTLQNTYFTVFLEGDELKVIGKISPQLAGPLSTNGMLPEVNSPEAGIFIFANLIKGKFTSENNVSFTLLGLNSTKLDFNNPSKFNSVVFSRNLLYVGGILQSYDGTSVVEQNFHLFPENVSANYSTTGGALSVGQYQYVVTYAWTDKFGQIQESTPSPAVTVTSTDVTGSVTLTIPTCRVTAKENVIIKVYRTQVNQVVYQQVTSELSPLENDSTVDTVQFLDVVADNQMASNQPVYTTGGVLPNVAPPSSNLIANYQDRVMLAGIEQDPNIIWFSKNKVNNTNFNTIPVEFATANVIGVNPSGGPITAIITMDDQLIIFKQTSIYVLVGEGPNDAGGGTPFPNVQLVSNSVGCDNPNSIVLTKNGLMFQSNKGIWLLPRGLGEPQYLGAGVDTEAKTYTITSATIDPNDNLVIFTTDTGPALVYEYLLNQWMTWTNHNQAVDSLAFNNLFVFAKSNGDIYVQNRNSFIDGTKKIKMKIVTPWLSFSQMQGYQSILRCYLLGEYRNPHTLRVSVGYDFNSAFLTRDIAEIDATTLTGTNQWGSSTPWGDDGYWGGEHQLYQFQINFARQRCTSFRMKIEDIQTANFGEAFTLSNMSFEVGAFTGHNRFPATKKVTTRSNE